MLTEIYIEALLVDEELADQVWEAWDAGNVSNDLATIARMLIASNRCRELGYLIEPARRSD